MRSAPATPRIKRRADPAQSHSLHGNASLLNLHDNLNLYENGGEHVAPARSTPTRLRSSESRKAPSCSRKYGSLQQPQSLAEFLNQLDLHEVHGMVMTQRTDANGTVMDKHLTHLDVDADDDEDTNAQESPSNPSENLRTMDLGAEVLAATQKSKAAREFFEMFEPGVPERFMAAQKRARNSGYVQRKEVNNLQSHD
eukprot:CAMPEP_0119343046 /NCGR_PEP_ID=MMETSP1333-20130426/106018_1 /TAXON_ID=418940 /ORGANISM="Scyphosphaera apsteinii, Strain RCC1455" /LENGTH=196 /DNA_ID=CAMNT_0007355387 /DNA_START=38 /DNA_END=625 /DNA_ORIENTATION=+